MIALALLPPPSLAALQQASPVAVFLDFDGTLVEIAPGPDAIAVPPDLVQRIDALASRLDRRVALVSGRGLDNLEQHAGTLTVARAGSHGAERIDGTNMPLGDTPHPLDENIVSELRALAAQHGILFENKRHGAALHYRSSPELAPQIEREAASVAKAQGLTIKHGKCVVELVRPGADKGAALHAFMETAPFAGSTPIFVGDDVTDEDGFVAAAQYGGFGIAVGERRSESAQYKLESVKSVHRWLNL